MSGYEGQRVAGGREGERRYESWGGHVVGGAIPADATGATAVSGV
ncbi:hypothetical protein [Streptomyces sp. NPDC005322]